jgi:hypothetical protein
MFAARPILHAAGRGVILMLRGRPFIWRAVVLRIGWQRVFSGDFRQQELRMTVRPPKDLSPTFSTSGALNVLEYELMSERADALGRHGLKVEKALAALAGLKDEAPTDQRERLLDEAADAVWAFFIQREICGLRDSRDAVHRYGIPKAVMARLGIVRRQ